MPRRCSVGARLRITGWSRITSAEEAPTLRLLLPDQLLGLLDRGRQALGVEPRIDERLEQLERHLLRQAALVQPQLRTDHDHRAAGIVDPLAEQVLAEPALLALEH